MYPVLFHAFGVTVSSYGVSKGLAALAAAFLLSREFRRLRWNPDIAFNIVIAATLIGFLGGKVYYLAEHASRLTMHDFGGSGFTWYGGFIAGLAAFVVLTRRHRLPLKTAASVAVAPLSVAYGIGRLGCLLAGDGTYGRPTSLPWGMRFPHSTMPTTVPVHPTPLYEAIAAFAIAGLLWRGRTRWHPDATIGVYLVLSGVARLLVEFLRINTTVVFGLTQPQLWSVASIAAGTVLLILSARHPETRTAQPHSADHDMSRPSQIAVPHPPSRI